MGFTYRRREPGDERFGPALIPLKVSPRALHNHITHLELKINVHRRHHTERMTDYTYRFWPASIIYYQQAAAVMPMLKSCRFMVGWTDYKSIGKIREQRHSLMTFSRVESSAGSRTKYMHTATFANDLDHPDAAMEPKNLALDLLYHLAKEIRGALVSYARCNDSEVLRIPEQVSVAVIDAYTEDFSRRYHLYVFNKLLDYLKGKDILQVEEQLMEDTTLFEDDRFELSDECPEEKPSPGSDEYCSVCRTCSQTASYKRLPTY